MPATLQGAVVLGIGNVNGSARTVTFKFYNANDDETTTIVSGYSIAANTVVKWPFPILMAAGDKIIMSASQSSSIVAHASITDSAAAPVATGFNPRGNWDNATTYNTNDLVWVDDAISTGRGAAYIAKPNGSANLNKNPTTETAFWMRYAGDGPEGDLSAADIGVTVQAYDADTAKTDVAQTWTAKQTLAALGLKLQAALEKVTITADNPASGDNNFDVLTQAIQYYTTANDTNWTLNVRGDGSNSLDSLMATGEAITIALIVTNTGTAYYQSGFKIDGNSVTPQWLGAAAPSAGTVNKRDTYTFTIIKTGSATFIVQASFAGGN
ncbi:hypothetical protein [Pseudorhodoplanes sp.]|uniref:hypothetical protein n=1 Tax=Pseudorhodoplanes sp. TaxID=1934341 RepID=UPI002BFF8084|nr:hypothetical protein [Pseudorhodoplanes sp.]HWV44139.1 hypothetical protein [Pseudorhodoplanes sp.]